MNDRALNRNAGLKPSLETMAPAANAPIASVAHPVVWVMELAVYSSSPVATVGRIADLPLVKNGEANMSTALKPYSSHKEVLGFPSTVRIKPSATTARIRSLAI